MASRLAKMFDDGLLVERIKGRLPYFFRLAELECSRAGKIGMQVGSSRETILVALLIYKFGEANVETEIPMIEPEVDVKLFGHGISIKTITGTNLSGVKLIWTVDAEKAATFRDTYFPRADILLAQINWGGTGGLYHIPLEAQSRVFAEMGRASYIRLPVPGTNPRGVEITRQALSRLISDGETRGISIDWLRSGESLDIYRRWVDLWRAD